MPRHIDARYRDPLDEIWLGTARSLGLKVVRSSEVFAATDGAGTLTLGSPESLDPDDSLGQMVFHELCHSLVQGPDSFETPDWGLDNLGDRDVAREHACLRVQATIARRHGLERVFAPTTDFREFYDRLGSDPLAGDDPSVELARVALEHAKGPPWQPHLDRALRATRALGEASAPFASPDSLWARLSPVPEPERP
ncbi:MAG: hypothetical protein JJ863_19100 [Deltaproteobacteria bacterium]|nr:hypothetical protein [Deltaproteobacteria bacterium]